MTGNQDAGVRERDFQRVVIDALRLHGWRFTHFRPSKTERGWRTPLEGHKGFPDIVAVKGKRVLFVELKSNVGRLSEDQLLWISALGQAAEAYTWRPKDFDEMMKVLGGTA